MYYYDEDYYLDDYDYLNELLEEAYYEGLYDAYLNEALTKKQKILTGITAGVLGAATVASIHGSIKSRRDDEEYFRQKHENLERDRQLMRETQARKQQQNNNA